MILTIWALFFLITPAVILYLTYRVDHLAKLGAIVIAYGVGLIVGNIGVLPENIGILHDGLTTLTVPVALPLLFFSLDLRQWRSLARRSVLSLIAAVISVTAASCIAFFLFQQAIGPEAWKAAGMLVGVYTGGTPNLAAIGNALAVEPLTYISVHGSDVIASAIVLLFLVSLAPRLYARVLPPFDESDGEDGGEHNFSPFFSGWSGKELGDMAKALGLAIVIFAVGGSLTLVLPEGAALPAAIVTITSLGIALSFIEPVRNLKNSFPLGYYLILVFSLTVSSMANVREITLTAPMILFYVIVLLILASVFHLILSRVMGVDRDTHIITATSFIFSPPFVPVVAAALGNRRVILSGIVTGVVGWVIGNYLGFAMAYTLRAIVLR